MQNTAAECIRRLPRLQKLMILSHYFIFSLEFISFNSVSDNRKKILKACIKSTEMSPLHFATWWNFEKGGERPIFVYGKCLTTTALGYGSQTIRLFGFPCVLRIESMFEWIRRLMVQKGKARSRSRVASRLSWVLCIFEHLRCDYIPPIPLGLSMWSSRPYWDATARREQLALPGCRILSFFPVVTRLHTSYHICLYNFQTNIPSVTQFSIASKQRFASRPRGSMV